MTVVFFVYGLSFLAMGIVVFILPRRSDVSEAISRIWLIGLFGLIHGLNEWADMIALNVQYMDISHSFLSILRTMLLPASFIFLVLFGSRALSFQVPRLRWLKHMWIACLLAWALAFFYSKDFRIAEITARYFICLPGSFLTALVFYRLIPILPASEENKNRFLVGMAKALPVCFLAYGFFSGFVVPKADFLPASMINYDTFISLIGIPVQIFRAAWAVIIAAAVSSLAMLFLGDRKASVRLRGGITRKITIWTSISLFIMIGIGIFLGYLWAFNLMRNTIGRDYHDMAEILATNISGNINRRVETLRAYADDPESVKRLEEKNPAYKDMSAEAIQLYMSGMDEKWVGATPEDPLIKEYLYNNISHELSELIKRDENIAEMFITDIRGGLVAASEKTSDFYQADEEWWQRAYNGGKGGVFVGELEYDESADVISITVAVPIEREGSVVGVCKAVVNADLFFKPLKGVSVGKSGYAVMIDGSGNVLFHKGVRPLDRKFANEKVIRMINEDVMQWSDIGYAEHRDRPEFIAWQRIENTFLASERINWTVIIAYDNREAYQPLYVLLLQGVSILSALLIFVIPFGHFLGRTIVKPINELDGAVMDIASGLLSRRIDIKTGDEIEGLADSFNKMAADLENTMVSRDSLMKEVISRDIAEKDALRAKRDWEDSFNTISEMITIHDTDFNILRANKAAESALGLSISDILHNKCFMSYHGTGRSPEECPGRKALKTGEPATCELYETRLDKFVEIKAMPRFDANRKIIGLVHIVRDITERKKAEERLGQALKEAIRYREIMVSMLDDNNHVRERLEKSLEKLRETQSQLVHAEKMEAIGMMASGVAHEVKNPLGIVLQGINYFEAVLPSGQKDSHEMLQIMKASIKRADSIVRALLDFSRSEELKMEEQDINAVIESSINLVRHKFRLNSIEPVCELKKELPKVLLDRGKMEQVFINLLNNAADAMPGGGKLHIRSYLSELKTPQNNVGNREKDIFKLGEKVLMVDVEDYGVGMDEDILNKIFDPFFTTKDRTKGTGLGLSVAKSIIEMHDSLINVESKKGRGTKFSIIFKVPVKGRG